MKKQDDKNKPPHSGSVSATDNDLMTWLHSFFSRGEAPEKIQVWQGTGPQKSVRDAKIMDQDFKANEAKNQEECARIANEIMALCQHDCNTVRKESCYIIDVIDRHRMAEPVSRKLGPLLPKLTTVVKRTQNGAQNDEDEGEAELLSGAKPMVLHWVDRALATADRERQGLNAVAGDLLLHQSREISELRAHTFRLMQANMEMFQGIQQALDQQLDREDRREQRQVDRARDKLFADGIREMGRIAGTLAPGIMRALLPEKMLPPQNSPAEPIQAATASTPADYGPSEERKYVTDFLRFIEEAKVDERLLGDWTQRADGWEPNPDKPGILTPDQVRLLIGVRNGWLSPDCVDELLTDGGHRNAITGEQIVKTQPIVPESAMAAVIALLGLRAEKRAARTPKLSTAA